MTLPYTQARVCETGGLGLRGVRAPMMRLWAWIVRTSGWRRWLLAFLLGVIAVAAMPPIHFVPALIPSFVGLLWLLRGAKSTAAVAVTGLIFGIGFFTAGLYWVANALLTQPDSIALLAPLAPLGLSLLLAPFLMIPALATRFVRAGSVSEVAVFAAAWTIAEWLRSWVLTGFPWNLIGTVWSFSPPMMQMASVTGVYGLSLLTVLAAAIPAVLIGSYAQRWFAVRSVLVCFGLIGLVWIAGAVRLHQAGPVAVHDHVRLRLVQPNIPQSIKWDRSLRDRHLRDQATLGALSQGRPVTHVIWSEVSAPLFLTEDADRLAYLGTMTPPDGLTILGTLRRTPPAQPLALWNSLVAVDHDGHAVGSYDKSHLVPFGEYMPLREITGLANFILGFTDFTPGSGVTTLYLPGTPPVSPLICYEVIFPGAVVNTSTRPRPEWLINLTNDGWYGHSAGPYQHLAAAQMRAVEEGLPLVRVANTGVSAIIDPYGRIRQSLGLGVRGIVDGDLPKAVPDPTWYARFGNIPILVLSGFVLICGTLLWRRD